MPVIGTGDEAIYFEPGEGVGPLVLHTGAGGDLRMWTAAGYPPRLSGRQLILIDHRGHGHAMAFVRSELVAAAVVDFLDQLAPAKRQM